MPAHPIGEYLAERCSHHGLDPTLMAAVIFQESRGDLWAYRYEPGFFTKYLDFRTRKMLSGYVPPAGKVTLRTEKHGRATSWGLFQVMGESARWKGGFTGVYLTELLDPYININVGLKFFSYLLSTVPTERDFTAQRIKTLLKWNGGGDPQYPSKVMAHIKTGDYRQILRLT